MVRFPSICFNDFPSNNVDLFLYFFLIFRLCFGLQKTTRNMKEKIKPSRQHTQYILENLYLEKYNIKSIPIILKTFLIVNWNVMVKSTAND